MTRWRSLALPLLVLSAAVSHAQVSGRVSGSVLDPSGAAVPTAKVNLLLPGGKTALLATQTNAEGIFDFAAVNPGLYVLTVDTSGFMKYTLGDVKVDPSRHVSLPPIRLALQSATQTVEVVANSTTVDTATAEVATTVTQSQIANLPVLDRQISNLFATQAGVAQNGRTSTVINGLRPSYANLTLDGINIQDSVRTNNLDYLPNKLTIAQVAEFTVSTSNTSPTVGGAASTISLVTPSGGNQYHGSAYWYNRNNFFSANDWFSNMNSVKRPFLNLNQVGGTLGGAIIKDKLFFYSNYEAFRQKRQTPVNNTILMPLARQGILQYRVAGGVQQFDVLKAAGVQMNPAVKALLDQVPDTGNYTGLGDGLNTTGYSFNARSNETRDNVSIKGDYNLSPKHVFSGSYIWNRDVVDRPSYTPYYTTIPPIYNDNHGKLVSGSWRSTITPTFTNELRGGFNFVPGTFKNRQNQPAYFLTGLNFNSPIQTAEVGEGRDVKTHVLQDNANWIHGRHSVSFGYQMAALHTLSTSDNGIIPSYGIGISAASPYGFSGTQLPGATATDVTRANNLLASLGGLLSTGTQTFNANSATSGFVPGAGSRSDMTFKQYAFYVLDNFKLRSNLTLTLGLRYDYMAPVDETDGLAITPKLIDNNVVATALGNPSLTFTGNSVGRPFYNKDRNNFAPNISLAWDVRGNGKTSVRAGFNIAYLNDNSLNSIYNVFTNNTGLANTRSLVNLTSFANSPTPISTPPFGIPTTPLEQFNLNPASPIVIAMVDPNLRTPYAQQWTASIQHEVKGWVVEGRYVANHAVKLYRGVDFNQIRINQAGFLDDFKRARNNMFLANNAGKGFNPNYDTTLAGSQPLTFLPSLGASALTNSTLLTNIRTGEIGTYAQNIQSLSPYPRLGYSFFPNPYLLYASVMNNISNSTYHSGQFEIRRRVGKSMQFQANYTFSKVLTDALGLRGLDAQLDNANPRVERARADFDLTHSIKLNHFIPLPFGRGKRFNVNNAVLNKVVEGWGLSGFMVIQSGNPVSILSARGTLNRGARSGQNTVDVAVTRDELKALTGVFKQGNGPYWFNPNNINPTNTQGVAPDGSAPFAGQVFFDPQPGSVGNLQRRSLDGPWNKTYNFALLKEISISERHKVELHVDAYNIFNHPNFYISDQNVNGNNFGKFAGQNYTNDGVGPRSLQFGLYYRF